jgi:protease-4
MTDYLKALGKDRAKQPGGDRVVAIVVAKGEIQDGEQPPGVIGGDSTAALLRKARTDPKVKAVVLRVDSPGGSADASEVIREECKKIRAAGKPLVVSMGAVAASGGYWISTASDEIWARPETITGSIGILGVFPTAEKPLARYLGVHTDGVGTTPFSNLYRPDRALDPEAKALFETIIHRGYAEFLSRVAEARKKTPEEVDAVAQGRVWSGQHAHELGLVDKLGGMNDAIASAAQRAQLGKDYQVRFIEKELKWQDRLLSGLGESAVRSFGSAAAETRSPTAELVDALARPLVRSHAWATPGIYALCEECADL